MKVALDISPTQTGHRIRGIGSYTQKLADEFKKGDWDIDFEFFETPSSPPPADVIHYPYFDLFAHTLPNSKKASRVVTIHDVIPLVFPQHFPVGLRGFINLFFQKRALKNCDLVICDSETSKKDIVDKLSYPEEKIKVVYLAPGENFKKENNIEKLKKISKKYNLPSNFALFVGDVNWNKNIEGLLKSIKIANFQLVMIGASLKNNNIPETQNINKLIHKLKLEEKIYKLGFINEEDLISIYNLASVCVLPSYYEGFGLPLLESMACGTPVVCSNVASLSEIGGNAAIFCDPEDPEDIAKKISQVLDLQTPQKQGLSTKCATHASSFSWNKVARETIDVYKSANA